ncbi:hypothetical protein BGW36DRAFT_368333 [Talaromyces proteolyticus]|uniref:Uncharacterized protein n=1 Tax=Talaromyces proteolyticus TaxID=1131652 RepID=A0AAD4L4N0_9EURO|nr:uncharacterized protein BGW36DRAFT_368333 [Talaromyces proteolyticus]KAH8705892.1 hypothetical protein BGW36DRAFT_368333 [Talaromyces proteolyticus]
MPLTGHTSDPFSDEAAKQHTVVLPAGDETANPTIPADNSRDVNEKTNTKLSTSSNEDKSGQNSSWKPHFIRQHSWSNQDLKRQMHDRLLRPVKGEQSGYTEKFAQD